jgi:hypothetical protein
MDNLGLVKSYGQGEEPGGQQGQSILVTLKTTISSASQFDLEALPGQFAKQQLAVIALDFDDPVFNGTAGAAFLLELA